MLLSSKNPVDVQVSFQFHVCFLDLFPTLTVPHAERPQLETHTPAGGDRKRFQALQLIDYVIERDFRIF